MRKFINHKTGQKLRCTFRLFRDSDVQGVLECIRAEYADTYFKRQFYHPDYLIGQHKSGHFTFLVVESEQKEIIGILALKSFFPEEMQCELASEIFKREARGYGISYPFVTYAIRIARQRQYSALYALPVTFHKISQELLEKLGFIPCGFLLGAFQMKHITQSYPLQDLSKHAMGIMIHPEEKQNAGTLYVPSEHVEFTEHIYGRLGVRFQIGCQSKAASAIQTALSFTQDSEQACCTITIQAAGADIGGYVAALMEQCRSREEQTCNALINMSDPSAPFAYQALHSLGFFYTGIRPLCGAYEFLTMHHPMDTTPAFSTFVLTGQFYEILNYIRACAGKEGWSSEA